MKREVVFHRYQLNEQIWAYVRNLAGDVNRIGRAFETQSIFGEDGTQFGFVNCRYRGGIVIGYFAQQGQKEIVNYIDGKRRTSVVNSFAHFMFALHVESGSLALQSTRIVDFVNLNLRTMRRKFPEAIEELLRANGIGVMVIRLRSYKVNITQEALYNIFLDYPVNALTVDNLQGSAVPTYDEFKLFNPRKQEDLVFRQIFRESIDAGLDSISLKSDDGADLRNSPLSRLSARVGDMESVTIDPFENGTPFTFKKSTSRKFTVSIESDNESSPVTDNDIRSVAPPLTISVTFSGSRAEIRDMLRALADLSDNTARPLKDTN